MMNNSQAQADDTRTKQHLGSCTILSPWQVKGKCPAGPGPGRASGIWRGELLLSFGGVGVEKKNQKNPIHQIEFW